MDLNIAGSWSVGAVGLLRGTRGGGCGVVQS